MDSDRAGLAVRAEFYLCLARAFETPADAASAEALRDLLADDLDELALELQWPLTAEIAAYREQAARLREPAEWLQVYSAIFLAPPVVARINAGHYLDGAVNGGSVGELEEAYARCGVQRHGDFPDLADHVSVQLQFAGLLFDREAQQPADAPECAVTAGAFLHAFPGRWIDGLCADLARAAGARELPANPWLPLALMLREAIALDAVAPELDPREERRRRAIERARGRYAARGVQEEDLADIRRMLEKAGLSTAHLPATAQEAEARLRSRAPAGVH